MSAASPIEHKADANLSDRSGWMPLMWATWGDNPALVKIDGYSTFMCQGTEPGDVPVDVENVR